tara:strand:- start:68 stop:328 length:261 start_codon:yes stop_codon:yes gene_type:complete
MGKCVMSRNYSLLSIFDGQQYSPGAHQLVPAKKCRKCKYCQYLILVFKSRNKTPPVKKRHSYNVRYVMYTFAKTILMYSRRSNLNK